MTNAINTTANPENMADIDDKEQDGLLSILLAKQLHLERRSAVTSKLLNEHAKELPRPPRTDCIEGLWVVTMPEESDYDEEDDVYEADMNSKEFWNIV